MNDPRVLEIDERTVKQLADELARKLIDEGKLIEVGFVTLCSMAMRPDAPKDWREEARMVFFAGAQHVFGSIMSVLDPGEEPTDDDMRRMSLIQEELDRFRHQLMHSLRMRKN